MNLDLRFRLWMVSEVLKGRWLALFLALLAAYAAFNIWINEFAETLPLFLHFNLAFVLPYAALSILIALLVALNLTLLAYKLKMVMGAPAKGGSITALGALGGLLGGACPGCFVGLLPTIAAAFGVTLSLSALPFLGFEIQVPTAIILLLTTYFLTDKNTCKVKQ